MSIFKPGKFMNRSILTFLKEMQCCFILHQKRRKSFLGQTVSSELHHVLKPRLNLTHCTPELTTAVKKKKVSSYPALAPVHFVIIIISQKSIAIKMTSTGTTITILCTKYCLQLH